MLRAGKRGNICVDNNVSATMCPRLPGPLCQAVAFSENGSSRNNIVRPSRRRPWGRGGDVASR